MDEKQQQQLTTTTTTNQGFAVPMLPVDYANQRMQPSTSSGSGGSASSSSSSSSSSNANNSASSNNAAQAAVIRRRRFSTAKIQPTRIKKVMQSDEEIGRMVQSVPVSIGRAMEHFAEKFLQAAADATQFTSSKTLNPQHMKQAVLNIPCFSFLEPLFKDIQLPQQASELTVARAGMTLKEQQMLSEQQKSDMATMVLANAQAEIRQMDATGGADAAQPLAFAPQHHNPFAQMYPGPGPTNYPIVQELQATVPLSPSTPTTQLVNGMIDMLKCGGGSGAESTGSPGKKEARLNGLKRTSTDVSPDEDRPRRGRPKKLKPEKCVDDELFEEASRNVAKEDKDRELMPPPALPIGRL